MRSVRLGVIKLSTPDAIDYYPMEQGALSNYRTGKYLSMGGDQRVINAD